MKFKSETERRHYEEDYRPAYDALMTCYPFSVDAIEDEQWQPIAGYEELYHISNYGRVKSFYGKPPRILKPKLTKNGYLCVCLCLGGKTKYLSVHVLVATAFIPNPDNKPEVNHRIGWKLNCYVGNLEWATSAENKQHAWETGLHVAKIKDEEVLYIRNNPDNLSRKELAEKFGVDETLISLIQTGKLWGYVGGTIRKSKRVSDEIRDKIRADYATGNYTQQQLAKMYNVSKKTIWRIINEN